MIPMIRMIIVVGRYWDLRLFFKPKWFDYLIVKYQVYCFTILGLSFRLDIYRRPTIKSCWQCEKVLSPDTKIMRCNKCLGKDSPA